MQRRRLYRSSCGGGGSGFTLIELMMVILILSLMAALVIALVARSNKDAQRTATQSAEVSTRKAIDLYREVTGELPDLLAGWDPLTRRTSVAGRDVGPVLDHPPINLLVPGDPSAVTDGDAPELYTDVSAFMYDYNGGTGTGRFIAAYEPTP